METYYVEHMRKHLLTLGTLEDSGICNSGADTEENVERTASFSKLCEPVPPAIAECTEGALGIRNK